jgi:hypothetical protein
MIELEWSTLAIPFTLFQRGESYWASSVACQCAVHASMRMIWIEAFERDTLAVGRGQGEGGPYPFFAVRRFAGSSSVRSEIFLETSRRFENH